MLDNKPYTFDRVFRLAIAVALIWGLIWLLGYLSEVLIPFAVAFLLAYLINPLVLFLQPKIKNHVLAVLISLFLVSLVVVVALMIVVPMLIGEIGHMGKVLRDVVENSAVAERAAQSLPPDLWQLIRDYAARDEVRQIFKTDSFWSIAQAVGKKVMPGLWGLLSGATSLVTGILGLSFIALYVVFLLIDYQKVKSGWVELLPPAHREFVAEFVRDFDAAMNRYFRAQAVVAAIMGVLFAIGFSLIGLPLGILLGIVVGAFNMVPYLQILGFPPAILLAIIHALEVGGNVWVYVGLVCLVFVIVQAVQDIILTPKIMGDVTGLSPAMILLSLSVWGKLLGMLGLLIALPMTCLLLAYYRRILVSPVFGVESDGLDPSVDTPLDGIADELEDAREEKREKEVEHTERKDQSE